MEYGEYYWGLYIDYHNDPLPPFPTKHQGVESLQVNTVSSHGALKDEVSEQPLYKKSTFSFSVFRREP